MNRDQFPLPIKRQLAKSTGYKFFGMADAVAKYNEPTQSQLDALERSYNATGTYVMESPEFRELAITLHAQGSRAIGTLVRPMRDRPQGFDVDIVLRLREAALQKYGGNAAGLVNDVYAVVKRYAEIHGLKVTRWERCATLEYADGMCVDIAPIIEDERIGIPYGATHARVPDRKLQLFEPTNPNGLVASFADAARVRPVFTAMEALTHRMAEARADLQPLPPHEDVQSRLLSRLVQLIKLHRNVAFADPSATSDFSPRSVFITALAAAAYTSRAPIPHDTPLDLLLDIVDTMPLYFERQPLPGGGEHWLLPNLTAPGDNLASGMNTPERQQAFFAWHSRFKADLESLLLFIEQRRGLDELLPLVEQVFGARAARAIREVEAPVPLAGSDRRRIVSVGTAVPGITVAMPARGHSFFGK